MMNNTWSDTCAAQNQNHILVAGMIFAVNSISHLHPINMKYLESGHTYLECDSMHSRIEARKKDRKIYTTNQMVTIIEDARHDPMPYKVEQLIFSDFLDMKELAKKIMKNYNIDSKGEPVRWLEIKWLQMNKDDDVVRFKYNRLISWLRHTRQPTQTAAGSSGTSVNQGNVNNFYNT